jgi:hypothetical protein
MGLSLTLVANAEETKKQTKMAVYNKEADDKKGDERKAQGDHGRKEIEISTVTVRLPPYKN